MYSCVLPTERQSWGVVSSKKPDLSCPRPKGPQKESEKTERVASEARGRNLPGHGELELLSSEV